MNRLKNKTALISGATSGIGKACAVTLASQGVNLILCGRREKRLIELKRELSDKNIKVSVLAFDVTLKDEVENNLNIILNSHASDV